MTRVKLAPYGSWKSPVTAAEMVKGTRSLQEFVIDEADVYLLEGRPQESGRGVIVRITPEGHHEDITPAAYSVRSRVHEFGGGAFTVWRGVVFFSNDGDRQIYRQEEGQAPVRLTSVEGMRYADLQVDAQRQRLICVREDHTKAGEPVNELISVDMLSGVVTVLASGADFYASVCLHPNVEQMAWLSWDHPLMPWDGTELWLADLTAAGQVAEVRKIAGGKEESIFQPSFAPDGTLFFVSDRSNWWNLFRFTGEKVEPVFLRSAEVGLPQWVFGESTYGFLSASEIILIYVENGYWKFAHVQLPTRRWEPIATNYTYLSHVKVEADRVVFFAASPEDPLSLVFANPSLAHVQVLAQSVDQVVEPGYLPLPEAVEFAGNDGATAHGIFYAPRNQDYDGPADERPPLLVMIHSGPTSAAYAFYHMKIAFWTSRGFAVLDVNYGGSTGYGRLYRERLKGNWGVVDVDDCVNGAIYLAERGDIDRERMAIRGGSAGGYTTLCALTFRNVFKAGACYYGVSDAEALAKDTHKFESRYTFGLIGPFPEMRELYRERSAIWHAEQLDCPVIFFQGLDDQVVPPNQSEAMFQALKAKGIPTSYLTFAGEGHGFRGADALKRSQESELYFYAQVFHFTQADKVKPVPIANWPGEKS